MTADSSVLVAAFATWHERHDDARRALAETTASVAHAELETYSVLTRLPAPHRASAAVVGEYLVQRHRGERLALGSDDQRTLLSDLAAAGVTGGAVYDALIAATARAHGLSLVTCDARAARTYELVGAAVRFL